MTIKLPFSCSARLALDVSVRDSTLAAALDGPLSRGFSAPTQQAVAACAGVCQSHVTYYVHTRNDVLCGTAQYGIEAMLAPMNETATRGTITRGEFWRLLMLHRATDSGFD